MLDRFGPASEHAHRRSLMGRQLWAMPDDGCSARFDHRVSQRLLILRYFSLVSGDPAKRYDPNGCLR